MTEESEYSKAGNAGKLKALLAELPAEYSVAPIRPSRRDTTLLRTAVMAAGGGRDYALEIKHLPTGQPARIRKFVLNWRMERTKLQGVEPALILSLPYLSERGMTTCKELDVGAYDQAGNCFIRFGPIYIEVSGRSNPRPERSAVKSLFSPKSSRVTRLLLSDAGRWWKVGEIAGETGISPGLASRIKTQLVAEELIAERGSEVRASDPLRLLNEWRANYSYRKNQIYRFYSLETADDIGQKIVRFCAERSIPCALGLFSAAALLDPYTRYGRHSFYIGSRIENVATALGLKRVPSGENVMLIEPYDAGVFLCGSERDGLPIVSDIQTYLDLATWRGRGEDAANHLLETIILPRWEHERTTNR